MSESVKIVSSVRSSDDTTFTVAFSSGDVLGFTKDEVLEYGLYIEDKFVDDFNKLCSIILAKRMMAFAASYVLFSMKSVYQVRVKLEEYCNKSELEEVYKSFFVNQIQTDLIMKANERKLFYIIPILSYILKIKVDFIDIVKINIICEDKTTIFFSNVSLFHDTVIYDDVSKLGAFGDFINSVTVNISCIIT